MGFAACMLVVPTRGSEMTGFYWPPMRFWEVGEKLIGTGKQFVLVNPVV